MDLILQNLIFFYVIKNINLLESYKASFFQNKEIQVLFDIVKPFVLEYHQEPSKQQVLDLIKLYGKEDIISNDTLDIFWKNKDKLVNYTEEWLNNLAISWGKWRQFTGGLNKVISYIKMNEASLTPDPESINNIINHVNLIMKSDSNFNDEKKEGHDFFDIETHAAKNLKTKSSGYKYIDACLNGGFSKKTLNVFMGGPKAGKSMWLCNLAAKSVLLGNNSIYITLEMSYQMVAKRIGANLFSIPIKNYNQLSNDKVYMENKVKEFNNSHLMQKPGKLYIEEFPTSSATTLDIEAFILHKEAELSTEEKPFKFDNIFIDYINIMKDLKNPNSENTYLKIKSICEDVRAMAQRNNWCIISLTQTNRASYESSDIALSMVSESAGLIMTVDSLFGIITNSIMRLEHVYYLKALAMRDSEYMDTKKKFNLNVQYLRIDEDENEDIIKEGVSLNPKYDISSVNKQFYINNMNKENKEIDTPELGVSELQLTGQGLFS